MVAGPLQPNLMVLPPLGHLCSPRCIWVVPMLAMSYYVIYVQTSLIPSFSSYQGDKGNLSEGTGVSFQIGTLALSDCQDALIEWDPGGVHQVAINMKCDPCV